jgi:hypothetical protein
MWEVVAAIIGVLLGALVTWLASRKKPNLVEYHEIGQYRFHLPTPAKIVFGGQTLDAMHLTRLALMNRSNQIIKQPQFRIEIDAETDILSVDVSLSPGRVSPDETPKLQREGNATTLTLPMLFPYALNQEQLFVDIYSLEEIQDYKILGAGLTDDQYGWAVSQAKEYIRLPLIGYHIRNSRIAWLAALAWLGFVVGWIAFVIYLIWQMANGLLNQENLLSMVTSPMFVILLFVALAFTAISVGFGFYGWNVQIGIPFTRRYVFVAIRRR